MIRPGAARTVSLVCWLLGSADLVALDVLVAPRLFHAGGAAAATVVAATVAETATTSPTAAAMAVVAATAAASGASPPVATDPGPPPAIAPATPPASAVAAAHADADAPPRDVRLRFELNSTKATTTGELDTLAAWLASHPGEGVSVEGHADRRGSEAYNTNLSWVRARWVEGELVARGVDARRIHVEGFGSLRPVANDATGARSRRVEIRITTGR